MSACLDKETFAITADLPDSCTGYVLVTSTEYKLLSSPFAEFDADLFQELILYFLLALIGSFAAGLIAKKLGR